MTEQYLHVDWPREQTLWVALDWIEAHCVVPNGFRKGQPFELIDWQAWCLANFYRVKREAEWDPASPLLGPAFVYRRSQIVGPQKAGKGPYTAAHSLNEGAGPALFRGWAGRDDGYACSDNGCGCGWEYPYERGEAMGIPWPTPLIQVTGYSLESTENVYRWLRAMVQNGPLDGMIPRVAEEFVRLPNGGRIDAVASSAKSRLGNPVTFAPEDEVGIWTAANGMVDLADTQRRGAAGMGGRVEETTNAWNTSENSVAQRTAESSKAWDPSIVPPPERAEAGRGKDVFRYHPMAAAGLSYTDRRERRKIHRVVYGASLREHGGHVDLDSIEAEAAEMIDEDPMKAERFFGNRPKSGAGSWLRDGVWDDRLVRPARVVPDGTPICLGFDGSESNDWTAFRACTMDGFGFTPTYGDDLPTYWDPAYHGGRIPRGEVRAALDELARRYRLVRLYADPRDWATEIEDWSLAYGPRKVFEWATNRISAMHDSLVRFVTDLSTGTYTHDDCPLTKIHVGNARRIAKPADRYILGKPTDHQKIDLAMCSVLAYEARCDAVAAGEGRTPARRRVVVS